MFKTLNVTDKLQDIIFDELSKVFADYEQKRFAIRSSAIGEDSDDLSSAGQNETILGCKGKESILEAIKKCWASLFTYQSVEYQR